VRKSLFSKFFITQIIVALTVIAIIIPTIFLLIGEYFVSTQKGDVMQDASRVAALTAQIADIGINEETRKFYNSGIEFAGGQSTIIVVGANGEIVAAPSSPDGVNLKHIDKSFIEDVKEGKSVVKLYAKGSIFAEQSIVAIVPVVKRNALTGATSFLGASVAFRPMPMVRYIRNRIIMIIIVAQMVAWLVAFIISFILTRHITNPLKKMRDAAKSIASGNFNERIPITSNDEIGALAESFNSMTTSLNELEDMRTSFLSDVSHELRTPMTIIGGFVEGILDGTIPESEQEKYLTIVSGEARRLSRLVSDLLEATRLEQGKIKIEKANVDMNRLATESIIAYEQKLTEKNISVSLNLCGEQCLALADKDSIKRVLINLIDNAIKFTPEGGSITITTDCEDKKVKVSVLNSGEGISEADLRHIWERFYKSDKSRGMDKKGVGLGLHIVKTIISQHGGEVFAESKEGEFAKFTFVLDEGSKNSVVYNDGKDD